MAPDRFEELLEMMLASSRSENAYRTGIRKCERFDFFGYRYGLREQTVDMRDTFEVRAPVAPTIAH